MDKLVQSLISSLNSIEVKGKENMDILLGCILTLEKLQKILEGGVYHERNSEGENAEGENVLPGSNG